MAPERPSKREILAGLALAAVVVGGLVYAVNRSSWEWRRIEGVAGESASPTLTVTVSHNLCRRDGPRVRAVEQGDRSVVISADQDVSGDCDDVEVFTDLTVELDAPLAERTIGLEGQGALAPATCVLDGAPSARCVAGGSSPPRVADAVDATGPPEPAATIASTRP